MQRAVARRIGFFKTVQEMESYEVEGSWHFDLYKWSEYVGTEMEYDWHWGDAVNEREVSIYNHHYTSFTLSLDGSLRCYSDVHGNGALSPEILMWLDRAGRVCLLEKLEDAIVEIVRESGKSWP